MIKVQNLSFSFGEKPLYKEVDFIVGSGQKVGLVGPNGSGKSTLFNLIIKNEEIQKGNIEVLGTLALVPQEVKHDPELENSNSILAYVDPENKIEIHQIKRLFSGLELTLDLHSPPQKLSGGQKTKLALAKALLAEPDTLLLDEPTNFMDKEGTFWVMNFLSQYPKTLILISHDLALMDNAIDKILAVDPVKQTIEEFSGNFTKYVKLKKEREELLKRQITVQKKHIKQMEEGLSKLVRYTSKKGVRARIRQQKRIAQEKAELPEMPLEVKKIKISLPTPANVGELPIRAVDITKSYGENTVLGDLNFSIRRGERVALIGPNGSGKSTLIKILMDIIKPDRGEVILNPMLKVGYYSQEFETFDLSKTLIDTFTETTHKNEGFARAFLGRFLFPGDKVFQKVGTLSGGEKTRLAIALLAAQDFNLLILDEPTTYLDVLSQRIILEALKDYRGAMLIVSHTPDFLLELAPNRAYLFPEQKQVFWDESLVAQVEEI